MNDTTKELPALHKIYIYLGFIGFWFLAFSFICSLVAPDIIINFLVKIFS